MPRKAVAPSPDIITVPHDFNPRPYQLAMFKAMDTGITRAFLRWSRRAGKDKTCLNYMIKKMVEQVGVYYYFFPTYQQGRKAIWENIQDGKKMMDHFPKQYIAKFNNNEMKIELVNGSLMRIIGTDDFDSIMGTNPVGCVFSEFSLQNPAAWDYIQPILAQNKGWAIFNGTPRGQNHMYNMEAKITGQNDWFVSEVQSLWEDLPNYYKVADMEEIDAMRRSGMDEATIEQEFGVSYTAGTKGTYYSDQISTARAKGRIGEYPIHDHKWVDTFWDIGKSDATAIWFRQTHGSSQVFIDYYEGNGKTAAEYVQMLSEKGYNYRTHFLPHDAAHDRFEGCAKNLLRECMNNAGINDNIVIAPKPNNKVAVINMVRSRFSQYFFNQATCSDGLAKLALYHKRWDSNLQRFSDTPVHDWTSHCADALSTEALTVDMQDDNPFAPKIIELNTDFDPYTS